MWLWTCGFNGVDYVLLVVACAVWCDYSIVYCWLFRYGWWICWCLVGCYDRFELVCIV